MEILGRVKGLVLGLALLLALGCNKADDKIEPEPDWSQFKCVVTHANGSKFMYNTAGQLIGTTYKDYFGDSSRQEMTYNAAGNIAERKSFNVKGELNLHYTYTYNARNLPDTLFVLENGRKTYYKKFEYDGAVQLVKVSVLTPGNPLPESYTDITYPAANQSKAKSYYRMGTTWYSGNTVLNNYDNKNHPYSHLGFYAVNPYSEDILISKHNIVSAITTYASGPVITQNWSITYNAQGYPTLTSLIKPRVFPSPYGSSGEGSAFDYSCQ